MARYTGTIEAPHGAEDVWHYLADLRSAEEWDPSVDEVELTGGEPRTEGARYQVDVRFAAGASPCRTASSRSIRRTEWFSRPRPTPSWSATRRGSIRVGRPPAA